MTSCIETLNHWGDHFLNLAWPMLWQSSLLIATIFVLDFALRRKIRAAIRYALWLIVLVKLLLPPSLALPTSLAWWLLPAPQSPPKPQTTAYVVTYGDQLAPPLPSQSQPVRAPIQPKMSLAAWALAASGAVSICLLAWLLFRWRQINQKVRRAKVSEKLIPILNEARRLTRSRRSIRLKLTEDSMSPAVCGLFRPVILLPQSLVEKLSAGQLRAVLLHEVIHLRRGDVWVNCAQALLQIFYWWHPLLWLANARIRRVREEAVDDAVMLALRDDAEIYAPTLLEVAKLAFNRPLASLGLVGILESRSALRQRIERLINFRAPRKAGLTVASIFGILAFTAVALPMGQAPEQTNEPTVSASIVSNSNFQASQAVLHALEQRTGVETLAEPEAITTAGQGVQRMRTDYVLQQTQYAAVTNNDNSTNGTNTVEGKIEAGKLVQDGKLLYEMGKFDAAEAKLKAAIALNPDNQGAFYYLRLVQQANFAREEHNRTTQTANSIEEVAKAWSPKVGIGSPVPNPYVTNADIHTSAGRKTILNKLNRIEFDRFGPYAKLPLNEVISALSQQTVQLDPEKKGIHFITAGYFGSPQPTIDPNTGLRTKYADLKVADTNSVSVTIYPALEHVRLADVLNVIVRGADNPIKYSIEDYGILFSRNDPTIPQLEMRVFKVDPNTFAAGLRSIPGLQTNDVATMAQSFFGKLGVNLTATASGRAIAFNDRLGLLFVKATPSELDTIERIIQALNQVNPQIHIKARFIEVPKKGFVALHLLTNAVAGQMTGILTDPEFRTVLQALEHRKGVVTLAEPECVTTSGRQVQMRATDIEDVVTNFVFHENPTNRSNVVPQTGKFEIGPTVDLVPYVLADGYTINLTALPQLLEFLGYVQSPDTRPATNQFGVKILLPTVLPHFRVRKADATVNLWDGQTLVLGNFKSLFVAGDKETNSETQFIADAEKKNGTADKELLVFITVQIVNPAGNRVHSDDKLPFNPSTIPPQPKFPTPSR